MDNLINKLAFSKMQEVKENYIKTLKYSFSGSDFSLGNYGARIFLSKNCKKYLYHITIEYNRNITVDNIILRIEKHYKNVFDVETKKRYIPIN